MTVGVGGIRPGERSARVEHSLARASCQWPEKVALVCREQRLTYADLNGRVEQMAAALATQGVRHGDRVVLWLSNSIDLVVAIYATMRCGAVFVVLDASSKNDRVAHVVADCEAALVMMPASKLRADLLTRLGSAQVALLGELSADAALSSTVVSFAELLARSNGTAPDAGIDRDLACLVYTSGSTGRPRGVMSAHHNVLFAVHAILEVLGTTHADTIISPLPLSFDYGLYQLLMAVEVGATLVLEPFAYPAAFLERLRDEHATVLPGVPTMWAMLVQMDLASFALQSLRTLTNTGAALPAAHIQALTSRLPQARLYSMYGLTETKRTLALPSEQATLRPDSVGLALPGTEVWLEDEQGQRLGADAVGELVVRGGHVMLGYWNAPEASAARFPPGPLPGERLCRTGDLFRRDADGYYYFVGRTDDVLKVRGQKVAPQDVERVLHDLKGVQEAAVVGIPDPVIGQLLRAYIVTCADGLSERSVRLHCRQHLMDFEVPDSVVFVDALPKTGHGKVARRQLVARDSSDFNSKD